MGAEPRKGCRGALLVRESQSSLGSRDFSSVMSASHAGSTCTAVESSSAHEPWVIRLYFRRDIKLSSLRICVEVMRRESVTATAQALNITQSAVSKNVLLVERAMGMPLFRRVKNGVVPHDHARAFLFNVAAGIQTIDTALADLALMRRLDELHLEFPFAGSRTLRGLVLPRDAGSAVGM